MAEKFAELQQALVSGEGSRGWHRMRRQRQRSRLDAPVVYSSSSHSRATSKWCTTAPSGITRPLWRGMLRLGDILTGTFLDSARVKELATSLVDYVTTSKYLTVAVTEPSRRGHTSRVTEDVPTGSALRSRTLLPPERQLSKQRASAT